ncbi:microsomal triglyceride transfer protein large subunit-like isoform X2 [Ornithodoros turicata]|uniref:microsomal triglyceride transfer protein large subunit-like isoform X2 n=1 Tax=Ornithodoros turicata TaxID=34597 RepID=UPI0031394484
MDVRISLWPVAGLLWILFAPSRGLELGTTYEYSLQSDLYLNEAQPGQEKTSRSVGYGLHGDVRVSCLWNNPADPLHRLLKIELVDVHLVVNPADAPHAERSRHASNLDSSNGHPLYVLQQNSEITRVWSLQEPSANIKKGVASLFQYQLTSEPEKAQVDVAGRCLVAFESKGIQLKKIKTGCTHPDHSQYFHPNFVQSASVDTKSVTSYEMLPDLTAPKAIHSTEEGHMIVNAWRNAHIVFSAKHKLQLKSTAQSKERLTATNEAAMLQHLTQDKKLKEDTIVARPTPKTCGTECKSLADTVKLYRDNLRTKNLATLKSAISFLRLLPKFREATSKEIVSVLKKNQKIVNQLLDLAAAAQTPASVKAALRYLDLEAENAQAERFLVSLLTASHPTAEIIADIHAVATKDLKNAKNKDSAVATLGALIKTYCRAHDNCLNDKEVVSSLKWMEKEIKSCKREDPCWQRYLGGLLNAAQPSTIDTFLFALRKGTRKAVIAALRALKEICREHLSNKVYDAVERVYGQVDRRHDSTARALAAELIFLGGDPVRIQRVVEGLPNKEHPELATFVTSKLYELLDQKPQVRSSASKVLQNVTVANYYHLAQSGSSAAFTKYLAKTEHLNSTYGINMELVPGGLLKTSSVDVNLETPSDSLNLISVGLFAGGLGGVAGGGEQQEDDEEEATGGMRLTLLGAHLRPYVFFVGTSELMGHVWSGTASEPTPALQANLLMMDHYQFVPLLNGLVVELKLQGVISLDLTGSIQISLWNRNSHSIVQTSGAAVIQASASVDYESVARSHVQVNVAGDSHLEFITDLDFYEKPYKMCIQMTQPGLVLRHNVRKQESVEGKKHLVRTLKRRSQTLAGKSYALHRKNEEYCSAMLAQD